MRIVSKSRLRAFWASPGNTAARGPLEAWYKIVAAANWTKWADVRATLSSTDLVGDCVVFNLGGNKYRLIARVRYKFHKVYILKVMAHAEYDRNLWPEECGCHRRPPERSRTRR